MHHEHVELGAVGVGQRDLVEGVGDAARVGVVVDFPHPVYPLAGGDHGVPQQLEVGQREAALGRLRRSDSRYSPGSMSWRRARSLNSFR